MCDKANVVLITLIFTFFYKLSLLDLLKSHKKYVRGYFHPDVSKNKIYFGKPKGDWQCYKYIHMRFQVVWFKNII